MRAFRIAYDGRPFHGFQRQPDVETVEDALLDALEALDVLDSGADAGGGVRPTPPGYAAAGRTDAGVSALAQTVAFEAPAWLTPRALSAELPDSIHAWAHAAVPEGEPTAAADFHATRDATRREYVYYLHAPEADVALAADVLDALAGQHDFTNLTPDDEGTVRTLETDLTVAAPFLELHVAAGGFPRHLVRRIAGLVESVATGKRSVGDVEEALDPSIPSDAVSVPTAPAEPLVLADVAYPELAFTRDERALEMARDPLTAIHARAAARTRVTATLLDRIRDE